MPTPPAPDVALAPEPDETELRGSASTSSTPSAPSHRSHQSHQSQQSHRSDAEREQLFAQHKKMVFFACNLWMHRNSGFVERYRLERDDLESVALIAVWNATALWHPSRGKFSTLAGVAVLSKLNHVLRDKKTVRRGSGEVVLLSLDERMSGSESVERLDLLPCPVSDVPEFALLGETRHEGLDGMLAQLEALPALQAEAIRLRYLEGYSNNDVATLMQTNPQTTSRRISVGLARLRAVLKGP